MNKIIIHEDKQLEYFYEELGAIISTRRSNVAEEIMEMSFEIGEAVSTSPLYKKFSKGQGELLEGISEHFKISRAQLGYCIQAYEKWGDAEKCREDLRKQLQKPQIFWSEAVKALPEKDSKRLETSKKEVCKHCKEHCPQ